MTSNERTEARYGEGVSREYKGDGVTVQWEPALCIHVANCIRSLPGVFDPEARPWVDVTAAYAAEIAAAIETCPTGALRYVRTDGAPQEQPHVPTRVQPRLNGPLFVEGDIEIVDIQGNVARKATRLALCRCGHSQNKPYCDLSHRIVGFRSS
jgi:uncharacterized Fe-S cluster protein YjdI/CDGSH-type Zn-finger protein